MASIAMGRCFWNLNTPSPLRIYRSLRSPLDRKLRHFCMIWHLWAISLNLSLLDMGKEAFFVSPITIPVISHFGEQFHLSHWIFRTIFQHQTVKSHVVTWWRLRFQCRVLKRRWFLRFSDFKLCEHMLMQKLWLSAWSSHFRGHSIHMDFMVKGYMMTVVISMANSMVHGMFMFW